MRTSLWLLIVILLIGCSDQKIIEELAFERSIAYDAIEGVSPKEKVRITYSVPLAGEDKKILFTAETRTSKQARSLFSKQNDRTLVSGQLRQVLFGKDLARHGIWEHIDPLLRDPSIGRTVFVTMVDGEARNILTKQYIQDPTSGEYIYDMLERGTTLTDIPRSNLHTFSRDYYDYGIDPAVPILKLEKDYARISGIAFFQNDRYVTEIDQNKNLIYLSMHKKIHTGEMSISIIEHKNEVVVKRLCFLFDHTRSLYRYFYLNIEFCSWIELLPLLPILTIIEIT